MMNLNLVEKHPGTVPAELLRGLTDEALGEQLWSLSLNHLKNNRITLGHFLFRMATAEIKCRTSGGKLEGGSFEIPQLTADELGKCLVPLLVETYASGVLCESLGKLLDHINLELLFQATAFLKDSTNERS
jgi:hypothetical protein